MESPFAERGEVTLPPTLFLVVSQSGELITHCHNIVELFRLREVKQSHDAKVFRYLPTNKQFDLFATWDKENLKWVLGPNQGIGFEQVSYQQFQAAHNMLLKLKELKL